MRVCIVGCGGIANLHARDVVRLRKEGYDIEVPYLIDIRKENAMKIKSKWGFETSQILSDYKEIIGKVDAAIICTPHTVHYQQVLDFIRGGVHVLVEKPMVCKLEHAVTLIEEAKRNKVVLEVAYQRHFQPTFIAAKNFISKGGLGDIKVISLILGQDWYLPTRGTWRQTLKLGGGGELLDSGSHLIDVAFWTTSLKPLEVYATIDKYDTEVDINTGLTARLNNGAIMNFTVAGDDPGWMEIEIFWGNKGRLTIVPPRVTFVSKERRGEQQLDTVSMRPSRPLFNFVDTILGKDENRSPPIGALYVIALTEAAYESVKLRRPVTIEELCERKNIDYKKFF